VEGATRTGYDPLRHPVSSLALSEFGWTQVANFGVTGSLTLAYAVGIRRALKPQTGSTWGPLLIGACGLGLLGAGLFRTDPLSGYPPGTPDRPAHPSRQSLIHQLCSAPVFLGMPVVCLIFIRHFVQAGRRGWTIYSLLSSAGFLGAFALASAGFGQARRFVALGGLFQRIALTVGWAWLTLLAIHLLRGGQEPTREQR
jgi:hypothetical protein